MLGFIEAGLLIAPCIKGRVLVVAVDVGQTALHPSLNRPEVLAFYKTDIRKFNWPKKVDYADFNFSRCLFY